MATLLLLFAHITLMITGVGLALGTTLLLQMAYLTGQVGAIRGVATAGGRMGGLIPILFLGGGVFGLLTAVSFGFSLTTPWLVIAYVLFAVATYLGAVADTAWARKVVTALGTTPDGPLTPEIRSLFADRRHIAVSVLSYSIFVLILFDMVVKPLS